MYFKLHSTHCLTIGNKLYHNSMVFVWTDSANEIALFTYTLKCLLNKVILLLNYVEHEWRLKEMPSGYI